MRKRSVVFVVSTSILLSGCAMNSGPNVHSGNNSTFSNNKGKVLGTLIGGIGGALVGKKIGGRNGVILGALVGSGIGYLIGNNIDKRRAALEKIAKEQNAKITFEDLKDQQGKKVGQSFVIHTEKSEFDSGKDTLNTYARPMFIAIAQQYVSSGQKVLIVGHTDSDGTDMYNQKLSERRAQNIARLFKANGVKEENIYYRGAGEYEPIASNQTSKGKAINRRVEVVEAPNELTMANYALNQPVNSGLYTKEKSRNTSIANNNISGKPVIDTQKQAEHHEAGQNPNSNKEGNNIAKIPSVGMPKMPGGNGGGGNMCVGMPKMPGGNGNGMTEVRFHSSDLGGNPRLTGVPGPYFIDKNGRMKKPLGSCNNEYFYSKKANLALKHGKTKKEGINQLASLVGRPKEVGTFSLVTQAHADSEVLSYYSSCLNDKVRSKGDIKKLSTGEKIMVQENYNLAPVLDGTTWGASVDGEFIMFGPAGVLRSNMQSVSCPELNIIKKGSNQPWFGTTTKIITYNGEDGLLYRIYPKDTSKIQCIDMAYPHGNPQNAKGVIYYKDSTGKIVYKKTKFFSLNKEGEHI